MKWKFWKQKETPLIEKPSKPWPIKIDKQEITKPQRYEEITYRYITQNKCPNVEWSRSMPVYKTDGNSGTVYEECINRWSCKNFDYVLCRRWRKEAKAMTDTHSPQAEAKRPEREVTTEEFEKYCMNCRALYRCDIHTNGDFSCQEPFDPIAANTGTAGTSSEDSQIPAGTSDVRKVVVQNGNRQEG